MSNAVLFGMRFRIRRCYVVRQGQALRLYFADGSVREIDLIRESERGGVFLKLKDPEYSAGVKRIWQGYLLEFPDGVTWGAETLWKEAEVLRPPVKGQPKAERQKDAILAR